MGMRFGGGGAMSFFFYRAGRRGEGAINESEADSRGYRALGE